MVGYLVLCYIIRLWMKGLAGTFDNQIILTRIFDGATFAGSLMLLAGIWDDDVMKLLGSTKPFLLVAGLAGLIYSLHALPPRS
jgi:hypothetical protein